MEVCTRFPTTRKNIHILAYFAQLKDVRFCITLHPKTQKRMKVNKFKVLLYLKKSNLDKQVEKPLYFDPFGQTGLLTLAII